MKDINENYLSAVFLVSDKKRKYPLSFAIITASNPMDQLLSKEENKKRNIELFRSLEKSYKKILPIVGCSPDLSHREDSFMVEVGLRTAIEYAKDFDQRAVFWVEIRNLFLVDCQSEAKILIGEFLPKIQYCH